MELPSYISQLSMGSMPQVQFSNAGANALNRASEQMSAIAADIKQKDDRITRLKMQADIQETLHNTAKETGADVNLLKEKYTGFAKGYLSNIQDPMLAAEAETMIRTHSLGYIDKATALQNDNLLTENYNQNAVNLNTISKQIPLAYQLLRSDTPEAQQAGADIMESLFKQAYEIATQKKADGTYLYSPQQQEKILSDFQKNLVISAPNDERMAMLGMGGGFDNSIKTVLKHEGGYNPSDGASGQPVNFGINQGAHKDIDVKKLTQAEAIAIYKKDYWDAYKIDQLPANTQAIVMDGVVNHWSGFKDKLVEAARKGATPQELIDMRQAEYDRLAKTGKYSKGEIASWNKRLNSFTPYTVGGMLENLSQDDQATLRKMAIDEMQKEQLMKTTDFAGWAQSQGINDPEQIVAEQGNRANAVVFSKDAMKLISSDIDKLQNSDEFIAYAQNIKAQARSATPQAIRQIVAEKKMPPEMKAAFMLAGSDKSLQSEKDIRLLFEATKAGDKAINEQYTLVTGRKVTDDLPAMNEALLEDIKIMQNEGYSPEEIGEKIQAVTTLAKMKGLEEPSLGADELAIKANAGAADYIHGEINDVKYRIPKYFINDYGNQEAIDTDYVESFLENYLKSDSLTIDDDRFKSLGRTAGSLAIPYLSPEGDTIRFRFGAGKLFRDKNTGQIAELKITDIIKQKQLVGDKVVASPRIVEDMMQELEKPKGRAKKPRVSPLEQGGD